MCEVNTIWGFTVSQAACQEDEAVKVEPVQITLPSVPAKVLFVPAFFPL